MSTSQTAPHPTSYEHRHARDTDHDVRVEMDCDDPMVAVTMFRHLRDLLDGPDISNVNVELQVDFGALTEEQKDRLHELARTMWPITVQERPHA